MRVIRATTFGGPDVLVPGTAPDPVAGPGEVLIDVAFAEILFLDTQLRAGWGGDYFVLHPPYVPGVGVSGTVRSVGEGVDPSWRDRAVIARTGDAGTYGGGGYAELATGSIEQVFAIPDGVGMDVALAALSDGYMGLSRLDLAGLGPGDTALVTAATGGIGVWLLPLARAAGAHLIAAARGAQKAGIALELGASEVVDYGSPDWQQHLRTAVSARSLDAVFDGVGGEVGTTALALLGRGGRFFGYGSASGEFVEHDAADADQRGISVIWIDEELDPVGLRRDTERALAALAEGTVRPIIGQVRPLAEAAQAHAAIAERTVSGKSLLRI